MHFLCNLVSWMHVNIPHIVCLVKSSQNFTGSVSHLMHQSLECSYGIIKWQSVQQVNMRESITTEKYIWGTSNIKKRRRQPNRVWRTEAKAVLWYSVLTLTEWYFHLASRRPLTLSSESVIRHSQGVNLMQPELTQRSKDTTSWLLISLG